MNPAFSLRSFYVDPELLTFFLVWWKVTGHVLNPSQSLLFFSFILQYSFNPPPSTTPIFTLTLHPPPPPKKKKILGPHPPLCILCPNPQIHSPSYPLLSPSHTPLSFALTLKYTPHLIPCSHLRIPLILCPNPQIHSPSIPCSHLRIPPYPVPSLSNTLSPYPTNTLIHPHPHSLSHSSSALHLTGADRWATLGVPT